MKLFKIMSIELVEEQTVPVDYVGLHPLRWGKQDWPEVGFIESQFTTEGVGELINAIDRALHEIGVPGPGYPAPVGNAYDILRAMLDKYGVND